MALLALAVTLALWGLLFWLPASLPDMLQLAALTLAVASTLILMPLAALKDAGE